MRPRGPSQYSQSQAESRIVRNSLSVSRRPSAGFRPESRANNPDRPKEGAGDSMVFPIIRQAPAWYNDAGTQVRRPLRWTAARPGPTLGAVTIQGVSAFTGEPIELELRGGFIRRVSPLPAAGRAGDARPEPGGAELPFLAPALLDLQVNGWGDRGYGRPDFREADLPRIVRRLDAAGTARHVATLVTAPRERLVRSLHTLSSALRASPDAAAAVAGVHVEGPFISAEDGPRGGHDAAWVRPPDFEEFQEWQDAAEGRIRLVTLAPEWPGALRFIERLTAAGAVAAIGHTAAGPGRIHEAVQAGARLSTHLGNAGRALLPRLPDGVWQQLGEDDLAAGLICDGFHLPPAVVRTFARVKRLERLVLVSDAAGEPPVADHLLDWDAAHFMAFTGCSLAQTVALCTRRPARLLDLPAGDGELAAGSPAHLALFRYRPGDRRLTVLRTIRAGQVVFDAGAPASP